jgi:hypothetical protein
VSFPSGARGSWRCRTKRTIASAPAEYKGVGGAPPLLRDQVGKSLKTRGGITVVPFRHPGTRRSCHDLRRAVCGRLRPTAVASLVRFESVPGEIQSSSIEFSNGAVTPSSLASSSYRTGISNLTSGAAKPRFSAPARVSETHMTRPPWQVFGERGPTLCAARAHSRPVNTLTPSWREMGAFLLLWLPRLQRTSSSLDVPLSVAQPTGLARLLPTAKPRLRRPLSDKGNPLARAGRKAAGSGEYEP